MRDDDLAKRHRRRRGVLPVLFIVFMIVLAASPAGATKASKGTKGRSATKSAPTAPSKSERPPEGSADLRSPAADEARRRGPSRIEFDDRLVQGQTNKANAIYLFERRESALRSLLKKRTDFHEEIDEMLE